MKALFLSLLVLGSFLSATSIAEPGVTKTGSRTPEQQEDYDLWVKDVAAVSEMRTELETNFLGGKSKISSDLNEGMRQYINWWMAPAETLVGIQSVEGNLRFKPTGGPSGSGKTAVPRIVAARSIESGLLDPSRFSYAQGDEQQTMDLSIIDRQKVLDADIKQIQGNSKRYKYKRALFKKTYAIYLFDEASHFGQPPGDLESAKQAELQQLIEKVKAREALVSSIPPETPKPAEPSPNSSADSKETNLAHLRYMTQLAEWELGRAMHEHKVQDIDIRAAERINSKYKRLATERTEMTRILNMMWQALSGGKYMATAERHESEDAKMTLNQSHSDLVNFQAKYIHEPIMSTVLERHQNVNKATADIKELQKKIDKIEEKADADERTNHDFEKQQKEEITKYAEPVQRKISDFRGIDVRSIAAWMRTDNNFKEAESVDTRFPTDAAFLAKMIREIDAKGDLREFHLGHQPPPPAPKEGEAPGNFLQSLNPMNGMRAQTDARYAKLAEELKAGVLRHYQNELSNGIKSREANLSTAMETRAATVAKLRATINPELKNIEKKRAEIETIMVPLRAYGTTQKEMEKADRSAGREVLIQRYLDLLTAHDKNIADAITTLSARYEINKFIQDLDAGKLQKQHPHYFKRLVALEQDVEGYLEKLKKAKVEVQYQQMLRMNPDAARLLVFKAVTENGVQMEVVHLQNMNVGMMMNYKPAETKVKEAVIARRADPNLSKPRNLNFDELHQLYKEHVPIDWAEQFITEHFPDLFAKLMKGTDQNPQAVWRRLFGDSGAFFFLPLNSQQMMTAVETTLQARLKQWQLRLKEMGVDVNVELYIHENVPASFVREGLQAELGTNVVLETVREAMGGLLGQLSNRLNQKPGEPFHAKLVLVNEVVNGGLQNLTLRFLPPNTQSEDSIISEHELPTFGKNSRIGQWPHAFVPVNALSKETNKPVAVKVDANSAHGFTQAEYLAAIEAKKALEAKQAQDILDEQKRILDDGLVAEEVIRLRASRIVDAEEAEALRAKEAQDALDKIEQEKQKEANLRAKLAENSTLREMLIADIESGKAAEAQKAEADRAARWATHVDSLKGWKLACTKFSQLAGGRKLKDPPRKFK